MNEDLVWYVSYGSNMLEERFLHYIEGGKFRNAGKIHTKCEDTTRFRRKAAVDIPYDMYYANTSGAWFGKGVSFLDTTRAGKAYGVAYLISEKQFDHIYIEENNGIKPTANSTWYNCKFELEPIDSIRAVTITNNRCITPNSPSDDYIKVLKEGLKENYKKLSDNIVDAYLHTRKGCMTNSIN